MTQITEQAVIDYGSKNRAFTFQQIAKHFDIECVWHKEPRRKLQNFLFALLNKNVLDYNQDTGNYLFLGAPHD